MANFVIALGGAGLYFLEKGGHVSLIGPLFGVEHSYAKLLGITLFILAAGLISFTLGLRARAALAVTTKARP
ncbi:hypothetical protein Q9290_03005 [Oceanimonas sp. CHS3-5]|uniref:hypothetical protein n=1 Tax=Oceanimonas sp. CHS3-5 TaxID=3068186 RepID=UPI00273F5285|nr:hypothetical protein [Oceanimonas sp. CHS3-5]MDP5291262.1 hypothetical protein [Oceanimonas sp. CHS3-5]